MKKNIIIAALLLSINVIGYSQTKANKSNAKSKPKLVKVLITDKSGKNSNLQIENYSNWNLLPKTVQMIDSLKARVLVFNNGCSRTCEASAGTSETGEWGYNSNSGTFGCDGNAGPLVCPATTETIQK
jgi:hypothetical protein